MNKFTRRIVEQACRKHVAKAVSDSQEFRWIVEEEYWLEVMERYGWEIKQRAVDLFRVFRPDCFSSDGEPIHLDAELSEIATVIIERKSANDEELRLDDYGDYHIRYATKLKYKKSAKVPETQIELF